jgi:hypothetical protein
MGKKNREQRLDALRLREAREILSNPEPARNDPPPDGAQDENDQERRLREIGAKLDALGPEYRLSPEKQARAEELLSKGNTLSRAERRELRALLRECDAIMLRRAETLDRVG